MQWTEGEGGGQKGAHEGYGLEILEQRGKLKLVNWIQGTLKAVASSNDVEI